MTESLEHANANATVLQSTTHKVKTGPLWSKSKEDLHTQLDELKTELVHLRTQKVAGGASSKLTKMCVLPTSPPRHPKLPVPRLPSPRGSVPRGLQSARDTC